MWRHLFGDVANGRLGRLAFLGYSLLLGIIVVAAGAGIGIAVGLAEKLISADLSAAQALLAENLNWLLIAALTLSGAAIVFANLNLTAKRLRDIGLPGWRSVAAILAATTVASLVSQQAGGIVNALCLLAMLTLPGKTR